MKSYVTVTKFSITTFQVNFVLIPGLGHSYMPLGHTVTHNRESGTHLHTIRAQLHTTETRAGTNVRTFDHFEVW